MQTQYAHIEEPKGQPLGGEERSALESIRLTISALRQRLANTTGHLGSLADRLLGTRPEALQKSGETTSGGGMIDEINLELSALAAEINAIEDRAERLAAL